MFRYYLKLGTRSLRRNPFLTALMVLILGFGVGTSMTAFTVMHVLGGDPMPHKSSQLFVPQLDNGPMEGYTPGDDPDFQLSYIDTMNLLKDAKGKDRTAIYGLSPTIDSGRADLPPFFEPGLATMASFFRMFEVPFLYGSAWDEAAERDGAFVVVISRALSERLYGDTDPTGKSLRIDDRDYRISGVIDHWRPVPKFYRLLGGGGAISETEELFVPFQNAIAREWRNNGWTNCSGSSREPGFAGFLKAECNWIQYWVELPDAQSVSEFRDYLSAYHAEQKKLGRMPRPENFALRNVREWLAFNEVVDADTRLQTWIAFGFLLVCLVNVIGLLLAKFTARGGEIGVRRALGATRMEIVRQYLVETVVIGAFGGVVGLGLSYFGLAIVDKYGLGEAGIARMDVPLLFATIALAVVSAVLAGLLPTWRAAQVTPAMQLKSQ